MCTVFSCFSRITGRTDSNRQPQQDISPALRGPLCRRYASISCRDRIRFNSSVDRPLHLNNDICIIHLSWLLYLLTRTPGYLSKEATYRGDDSMATEVGGIFPVLSGMIPENNVRLMHFPVILRVECSSNCCVAIDGQRFK